MVEHGDDVWLDRIGRDGNGALYKMYNNLSSASGNEKKTRTDEGTDDLTALINSLDESIPLTNRVTYAYDNLDLPQTASYFADMALASSQDVSAKNYYLYRDSDGTGEWAITPWDVDLTWGRNWIDAYGYFTDTLYTNNVLSFDNPAEQYKPANRLFDLFFGFSDFRQMYLRRLRTLMDTILMPPGTPTNALVIEPLIRQYESQLNPPGISPSDTALDYTAWGPRWGNTTYSIFPNFAEQIISTHLPGRRNFLYSTNATLNGDFIPAAQPANTVVLIGSWDYNPVSGNPERTIRRTAQHEFLRGGRFQLAAHRRHRIHDASRHRHSRRQIALSRRQRERLPRPRGQPARRPGPVCAGSVSAAFSARRATRR